MIEILNNILTLLQKDTTVIIIFVILGIVLAAVLIGLVNSFKNLTVARDKFQRRNDYEPED